MRWLIGLGAITVSLAVAWATVGASFQAGEPYVELLDAFPPDTDAVFFVDVTALEEAGFLEGVASGFIADQAAGHVPGDFEEFVEATGFDPVRDIHHLMIGRSMASGMLAVANASFDRQRLEAYFEASDFGSDVVARHRVFVPVPDEDWSVALTEDMVVFGNPGAVGGALTRLSGAGESAAESDEILARISELNTAGSQVWGTGAVGQIPELAALGGIAPPMALDLVGALQRITYEMGFDSDVRARIHGEFSGADTAMRAGDLLRGLVALGKMGSAEQPDLAELLNGFVVVTTENNVDIQFTATRELFDRLGNSGLGLPSVE